MEFNMNTIDMRGFSLLKATKRHEITFIRLSLWNNISHLNEACMEPKSTYSCKYIFDTQCISYKFDTKILIFAINIPIFRTPEYIYVVCDMF